MLIGCANSAAQWGSSKPSSVRPERAGVERRVAGRGFNGAWTRLRRPGTLVLTLPRPRISGGQRDQAVGDKAVASTKQWRHISGFWIPRLVDPKPESRDMTPNL